MKSKEGVRRLLTLFLASLVLLLWVLSIAILVLSTIMRDEFSKISLVTENTTVGNFYLNLFFPVVFPVLISVSCFLFVIGCLGCCGAYTESQILLGWFFFSILVTFFVELSAGIWRMLSTDLSYGEYDLQQLKFNIEKYSGQPSFSWFKRAWNDVQQKFQCCGVYNYTDWLEEDPIMLKSCCINGSLHEACVTGFPKTLGCGEILLEYLGSTGLVPSIAYVTVVLGITQFLVMVITLKLWLMFCFTQRPKDFGDPYFYPKYNAHSIDKQQKVQENQFFFKKEHPIKGIRCSDSNFHVIEIATEQQFSNKRKQTHVHFNSEHVNVQSQAPHSAGSNKNNESYRIRNLHSSVDESHEFCVACSALHQTQDIHIKELSNEPKAKIDNNKNDDAASTKCDELINCKKQSNPNCTSDSDKSTNSAILSS